MTEGVDYFVRVVHFPNSSTPGQIWLNDDDTYDIYLDDRLTDEQMKKVLAHELRHIECGHFWSQLDIVDIEREADGKTVNIFGSPDVIPEFASLDSFRHYVEAVGGGVR